MLYITNNIIIGAYFVCSYYLSLLIVSCTIYVFFVQYVFFKDFIIMLFFLGRGLACYVYNIGLYNIHVVFVYIGVYNRSI